MRRAACLLFILLAGAADPLLAAGSMDTGGARQGFNGIAVSIFLLFIAQLFNLQVVQGTRFVAAAEGNRTKEINIPAPRGIILDRNGTVLARNVAQGQ